MNFIWKSGVKYPLMLFRTLRSAGEMRLGPTHKGKTTRSASLHVYALVRFHCACVTVPSSCTCRWSRNHVHSYVSYVGYIVTYSTILHHCFWFMTAEKIKGVLNWQMFVVKCCSFLRNHSKNTKFNPGLWFLKLIFNRTEHIQWVIEHLTANVCNFKESVTR